MRKRWILGVIGALGFVLAGCGGGDSVPPPPPPSTAPLLTVTYTVPNTPGSNTVQIFSDLPSDGDIAFDPVRSTYTVAQGPSTVLFGIDSATPNLPEYRAFLTFPLDGFTGQPFVPEDAVIVSGTSRCSSTFSISPRSLPRSSIWFSTRPNMAAGTGWVPSIRWPISTSFRWRSGRPSTS